MKKKVALLYDLQQLHLMEEEIKKDPKITSLIQGIRELITQRKKLLEEESGIQEQIHQKNRLIRKRDHEEQSLIARNRELEEEMYSGRVGVKELGQIQKKIGTILHQKERLADEILQLMEEVDLLEEKEKGLKGLLERLEEEKKGKEDLLVKTRGENAERLEQLKEEKRDLKEKIGLDYLQIYREIKENRGGRAVAIVDSSYCLGCRVGLPATIVDKLYGTDEMVYCESCHRILFLKKR